MKNLLNESMTPRVGLANAGIAVLQPAAAGMDVRTTENMRLQELR